MASPAHIRVAARQRMRRLLLACGVGGGLLIALTVAATTGDEAPVPPAAPPTPGVSSPSGAYVEPEQWVSLPSAARRIEGTYPVGFTHTPRGAVAALVAEIETGWGLDAARAVKSSQIYADPGFRDRARAKVYSLNGHWRQFLGLPAAGDVPAGAYLQARVVGTKWTASDADRVRVQVLVMVEGASSVSAEPRYRLFAAVAGMRWDAQVRGGDWTSGLTDGRADDVAAPGTAEFNRLGWRALQVAPE